tara:strand:- start:2662 stop:4638 length:1977 start_codon:yes stop_codon:yes gene_type:complete
MAIKVVPVTGSGGGMTASPQGRSVHPQPTLNKYPITQSGFGAFTEAFQPYMMMALKKQQATKERERRSKAIKESVLTGDLSGLDPDDYLKMSDLREKNEARKEMALQRIAMKESIAGMKDRTANRLIDFKDTWHQADDTTKRYLEGQSDATRRWLGGLDSETALKVINISKTFDVQIENLRGKNRVELENIRIQGVKDKFERENPILHGQVMEKLGVKQEAAFALQDNALQSQEFLELSGRVWKAGQSDKEGVRNLAMAQVKSKYERILAQDKSISETDKAKLLHLQNKEIKGIEQTFTAGQNNKNRTLDQYKHDGNIEYQNARDKLVETGKTNRHRVDIETKRIMQATDISWDEKKIGLNQINTQANMRSKFEIDTKLQNNLGTINAKSMSKEYGFKEKMAATKHVYSKAILQQSLYGEEARDLRKRRTKTLIADMNNDSKMKVEKIRSLATEGKLSKDIGFKLRNAYTKDSKEFLRLQSIVSKVHGALKGPQSNSSDKIVVQGLLNMIQEAGKGSTRMYKIFEGSGMIGELNRVWNDLFGKESRIPHGQIVDLYENVWDIWSNAKELQFGRRTTALEQANEAGAEDYWISDFTKNAKLPKLSPMGGTGKAVRWTELLDTIKKDFTDPGRVVEEVYESFSPSGQPTISDDELMKAFQ